MESVITVQHLKKSYKDVNAVDDISFDVGRGQLFAFLGLNGAGKSTTINCICGILVKDSGSIIIDEKDSDRDRLQTNKKIGIVFQNSVLDRDLKVYDNLRLRAALYGVVGDEFLENLKTVSSYLSLSPLLNKTLKTLSGGQQRKVDLARALIHKPSILILDEPTTGLDPQTRIAVWNCLDTMREKENLTVFLTTHYMEESADADYVVIIDKGHIAAEGTPLDLKNRYAGNYIKLYSRSAKSRAYLSAHGYAFSEKDSYDRISVETGHDALELLALRPSFFTDFEVIKGSMDDIFLAVTGKEFVDEQSPYL